MIHSLFIRATSARRAQFMSKFIEINMSWPRQSSNISSPKEESTSEGREAGQEPGPSEKPVESFKFTDYDCIGFDLDDTLSCFRTISTVNLGYEALANYMVKQKGYDEKILRQEVDYSYMVRGLVIDDEHGNLVRLSAQGKILRASHGCRILMNTEIPEAYSGRRWKVTDAFIKDPLLTWNSDYWQKMYPLLDIFDIPAGLVFARCVEAVDKMKKKPESYGIWPDLLEAFSYVFDPANFSNGKSHFYKQITEHAPKYYHRADKEVLRWLHSLRDAGKKLFLVTSSCRKFGEHTARETIGPNWKDFFEVIVCDARKPGFFTLGRPFVNMPPERKSETMENKIVSNEKINSQGNFKAVYDFFKTCVEEENPKFLYIGDNILQDVYAPDTVTECDTVFVCPELENEGFLGHERREGLDNMISYVWGSFFFDGKEMSNWCNIMKKHSQLCVPSLEYVASLPLDHEYPKDHLTLEGPKLRYIGTAHSNIKDDIDHSWDYAAHRNKKK